MKHVEVYDPDTKVKKTIPMAELSPAMVRGRLPDGSIAWIDATKVKPASKLIQPPLTEKHKRILQQIKRDLDEVLPCTLADWEHDLRSDQNLEREIHVWRWIAHRFKRLASSGDLTLARKDDIFQLCLRWTMTKDVEAAVATTSLNEITQAETREMLDSFSTTDAEFFGGPFAEYFPEVAATDYSVIKSLDQFKALALPATLTLAVDWSGEHSSVVHGKGVLQGIVAARTSRTIQIVAFAVDFGTAQLEHLLAAVMATKGSYEWNGKVHYRNS